MADPDQPSDYKIEKENGEVGVSSREYTGKAKATYSNGETYDGDFVEGIREGKGKYNYASGFEYEGEFQANHRHGIGKMSYKGKEAYLGEYYGYWENGKKHGEGLFTYPSKDSYSGWWKYGKREGKGTYTFAETGMKLVGTWTDGNFVKGKWVLPNGTFYEGDFDKNQPKGEGKWFFTNSNIVVGNYSQTLEEKETDTGDKKIEVKLGWKTKAEIVDGAEKVNTMEALQY